MFKKNPEIQYESVIPLQPNLITPSKSHIPDWYKKISSYKDDEIFSKEKMYFNKTVKHCMPFLDSLTTGYMIKIPYDIYVKNDNGVPFLSWRFENSELAPSWRPEISHENIVPVGHYPMEYTWRFCVSFSISKGYSIIVTHPFNRNDLPFTTLTGIIDGDHVTSYKTKFPFYIRDGFEGIIKQGTPIAQLIPFRQEKWKLKQKKGLLKIGELEAEEGTFSLSGWYKKNFWTKKDYD